ncbi:AraC family transcriptional regulator [Pseudomonas alcaligenes]|uniref:AraC family transcriptional regulator n=1 Tax=Aquipseudomonas alcaligenes TaxID=43263 RepID=A0ABR7S620_AQUAC|nr:GlxA family transcriptional regulator [Pseudomonas alcaligenes]MBC9251833.1 AraC family transcriptional regulator [Pseudomonas alcaligenes]
MKTVAILLFPDVLMLDVAGPLEVFSIANRYLAADAGYRIVTVSGQERSIRASNGLTLQADVSFEQATATYDILLVPGGPGAYNQAHGPLLPWLVQAAGRARQYGSICTGAFILGEAGLLDGHRVTTHWNYTERLARAFPRARVEAEHIYLNDRRLITSGGVTAGIDLALSIVAEDHGRQVALDVAKVILVVMKRQGGQAQFSPLLGTLARQDSPIARVQSYVLEHLEETFSIERMATLAAMSSRHFARVFTREMQMTPMQFLHSARIDRARQLLESSELPLKTVAYRSGFGSVRHMRFQFSDRLGLTPLEYRRQFS